MTYEIRERFTLDGATSLIPPADRKRKVVPDYLAPLPTWETPNRSPVWEYIYGAGNPPVSSPGRARRALRRLARLFDWRGRGKPECGGEPRGPASRVPALR